MIGKFSYVAEEIIKDDSIESEKMNEDVENIFDQYKGNILLKEYIAVLGVGGAGINVVNNMINMQFTDIKYIVMNTDYQSLSYAICENKIQLGPNLTKGLGAGSDPEIGRKAAEESIEEIRIALKGISLLFITCGMGGGTGTGAVQVIVKVAKEMDILTILFVTKPFAFEGNFKKEIADKGVDELEAIADSIVVISNNNLFQVVDVDMSIFDAFRTTDMILYIGVKSIVELLTSSGLVNLDFNDIKSVLSKVGRAMIGSAEAEGEDRAQKVAKIAILNPLLENKSIKGASKVLVNIAGGHDITLYEVDTIINIIKEDIDENAFLTFGAVYDDSLEGRIRVSVIATGLVKENKASFTEDTKMVNSSDKRVRQGKPRLSHSIKKTNNIYETEQEKSEYQKDTNILIEENMPTSKAFLSEEITKDDSLNVSVEDEFFDDTVQEDAAKYTSKSNTEEIEEKSSLFDLITKDKRSNQKVKDSIKDAVSKESDVDIDLTKRNNFGFLKEKLTTNTKGGSLFDLDIPSFLNSRKK